MPGRHRHFRALTEEFRRHLERSGAWPPLKAFPSALEDKGGGKKADLAQMKAGAAVPEKYLRALVELLRGKPVLTAYLANAGIAEPNGITTENIIELIAGPLLPHPAPSPHAEDSFMQGLDGLARIFSDYAWSTLVREGTLCRDEADVREAVWMTLATVGRHLRGADQPAEAAISAAERHMRISREGYLARVTEWWRQEPWTVAFAVVDRQRVACSFVLPLQEPVYQEIRAGARVSYTCSASDLETPSRTLIFENVGEKPESEYAYLRKRTDQQLRTLFLQAAWMSGGIGSDPPPTPPLRILSFAGSPKNERRLKKMGFRRTGTHMPGFGIPFLELDERKAWLVPLVIGYLSRRLRDSGAADA